MKAVAKYYDTKKTTDEKTGEIQTHMTFIVEEPNQFIKINVSKFKAQTLQKLEACKKLDQFIIGFNQREMINDSGKKFNYWTISSDPETYSQPNVRAA